MRANRTKLPSSSGVIQRALIISPTILKATIDTLPTPVEKVPLIKLVINDSDKDFLQIFNDHLASRIINNLADY
jgi:hypothetical protein